MKGPANEPVVFAPVDLPARCGEFGIAIEVLENSFEIARRELEIDVHLERPALGSLLRRLWAFVFDERRGAVQDLVAQEAQHAVQLSKFRDNYRQCISQRVSE